MRTIEIYLDGNWIKNSGHWRYYIAYKDNVIKRVGILYNCRDMHNMQLYALYDALKHVKEPCYIQVYSKIFLGFKNPKQSKNKELLKAIQTMVNKSGHIMFYERTSNFKQVEIWENNYGQKEDKSSSSVEDNKDWKSMYDDLLSDTGGKWTPMSGGY